MQPAACIAAVATWPAEQAESETVRQGACGKAAGMKARETRSEIYQEKIYESGHPI